jgi:lipopolysaccharide biosynthesis regulator YciM
MIVRKAITMALAVAATVSCRPDDQRTDRLDPTGGPQARENMPSEAVIQLDSGNLAIRNDDLEAAVAHYTRVTELAPDFGSGWFGLYMAHRELGDEDEAAAALARARSIVPGATLLHQDSADTIP